VGSICARNDDPVYGELTIYQLLIPLLRRLIRLNRVGRLLRRMTWSEHYYYIIYLFAAPAFNLFSLALRLSICARFPLLRVNRIMVRGRRHGTWV
jgi:hypothetical protein